MAHFLFGQDAGITLNAVLLFPSAWFPLGRGVKITEQHSQLIHCWSCFHRADSHTRLDLFSLHVKYAIVKLFKMLYVKFITQTC